MSNKPSHVSLKKEKREKKEKKRGVGGEGLTPVPVGRQRRRGWWIRFARTGK